MYPEIKSIARIKATKTTTPVEFWKILKLKFV